MRLNYRQTSLLLVFWLLSTTGTGFGAAPTPEKAPISFHPVNFHQDTRSGFRFNIDSAAYRQQHVLETELDASFITAARQHNDMSKSVQSIRRMYANNAQNAWNAEDFDALEQQLHQFREVLVPTLRDGSSTQYIFYGAILKTSREAEQTNPYFSMEKKIERWRKACPDSITPELVLAQYYLDKAYQARGTDYASKTSAESFTECRRLARQAETVLTSAIQHGKKPDPQFYVTALAVLQCLGADPEQAQALFQAGIKLDPDYRGLYDAMAFLVMPRWYGDTDDLADLAFYYTASHPTYHNTDGLYTRIVEDVTWGIARTPEEFLSYGFSWPIIKSGYIHDAKFWGLPTWRLDMFCWLAVMYDDKATAKTLFELLQNDYDRHIWGDDDAIRSQARDWAIGQTPNNPLRPPLDSHTPNQIAYINPGKTETTGHSPARQ